MPNPVKPGVEVFRPKKFPEKVASAEKPPRMNIAFTPTPGPVTFEFDPSLLRVRESVPEPKTPKTSVSPETKPGTIQ